MPDTFASVRRPRAARVATITAVLLAVLYAAGAWWAHRLAEAGEVRDDLLGVAVLGAIRPFWGDPLAADMPMQEWLPWLAGLGVALVVFWAVAWLATRKGAMAAFVGTWFAIIVGTAGGAVASAWVWADQNQVPDGAAVTELYVTALDLGLRSGFLFGLVLALVAALLAAVLRTSRSTDSDGESSAEDPDSELMPELSFAGRSDDRG